MLASLLTYLKEGSTYYGLEILENQEKKVFFHLIEVVRKREELFIQKEEVIFDLNELVSLVKKGAPLFLVLNTSKVLTKITEKTASDNSKTEAMVHSAFPNLDFDNFYYQLKSNYNGHVISICKREYLIQYLQQLSDLKLNVISISLGISSIDAIAGYLEVNEVSTTNIILSIKNKSIYGFSSQPSVQEGQKKTYDVNGISVSSDSILAFSSVLSYLQNAEGTSSNLIDLIKQKAEDFQNIRFFNLLLRGALIVIPVVLLINFLLFNNYFQKVGSLQESLTQTSAQQAQLKDLKNQVESKKDKVEAVLSAASSKTSYYLDQIAMNVPNSLLLTEIQYQPLVKPMRALKAVEIAKNEIRVSGVASNSEQFYDWIEALEKLSWVANVETTDYDYLNSTTSNFSIKIEIDE